MADGQAPSAVFARWFRSGKRTQTALPGSQGETSHLCPGWLKRPPRRAPRSLRAGQGVVAGPGNPSGHRPVRPASQGEELHRGYQREAGNQEDLQGKRGNPGQEASHGRSNDVCSALSASESRSAAMTTAIVDREVLIAWMLIPWAASAENMLLAMPGLSLKSGP